MKKLFLALFILLPAFLMPVSVYATQASLKCLPSSGTYKIGETFTVDLSLDTRSFQAYGADIAATFDPSIIEATGTTVTPVTTSTNWTTPTTKTISAGKVRLDYGKSQAAYSGTTSIGQISFKAKAAGQTNFNILFFQPYDDTSADGTVAKVWGKKDNSNITNILTDTNGCVFVVEGATPTTAPTSGPSSPPLPTELPKTGAVETTVSLGVIAVIFMTIGVIIPVFGKNREY